MAYTPKTRTVTEKVPEWLSDTIDWEGFDFHEGEGGEGRGGRNPACTKPCMELLRKCESGIGKVAATDDGGWPRCGWGVVVRVGMAAKWPYWQPRPTVEVYTSHGPKWIDWSKLTDVRFLDPEEQQRGCVRS